jgi:hypothetical protein
VLLRLAYLGVTNGFGLLRLLSMSARDKDAEILALRHQITVLERQLGKQRVRFTPTDRAFLAALLHRLPRHVLRRTRLLVRPDTVLRWTATFSHAATRPVLDPSARDDRAPCTRSEPWCCAWGAKIPAGATGECTVSCSCWG